MSRNEREREPPSFVVGSSDAADRDFRAWFESAPASYLVVKPDRYEIVAASDAYLRATMTRRDAVTGRELFDVFPDDPREPWADGTRNLRASFERVKATGLPDVMAVQRYPIRRPASRGGDFEERWWSPLNAPVFGPDATVTYIIHRVEDVTALVRRMRAEGQPIDSSPAVALHLQRMAIEIMLRGHELQQANERLRQSEEALRAVFDNVASGIARVDPDDRIVAANDRLHEMLGYGRDELIGTTIHDLTYPEDRPRSDELNAQLRNGDPTLLHYEKRYVKRDGSPLWVLVAASPVRDDEGRHLYMVTTVVDISRRKAAEEEVRLQAAALQAAPNAISLSKTDERGTIVWVNQAFTELTGYPASEAIGRTHHILSSGKQGKGFYRTLWNTIQRGDVWRGELVNRRRDGTVYDEEMGVTPLKDENGTITHYVAIKQDISARKRAEEALRNSEQRLSLALAAGGHGAWEIDLAAERVIASSRACEIFGVTDPTSCQTLGQWTDLIVEEDREASRQALRRAASGVTGTQVEFRVRRASDGAIRWVSFIGNLVRAGTLIGILTDISERKQAEERLSAELHAITRLHDLATLSIGEGQIEKLLAETLDAAMDFSAGDFGTIQLFDTRSRNLKIVAHRGVPRWWVDFWDGVARGCGACDHALRQKVRVVVEDVERSDLFGNATLRDAQLKAGIRALQSTPLVTRTGQAVGCFSTHYKVPHRPSERTLRLLDLLASQAADMIAKTQAEAALRESQERLSRANAQLSDSDRRKDEFIAVLSHELRNPLAPIRYALPVLQREHLNQSAARAVSVVDRQVDHLTRLVDDLLDVSRITRGKIELRREPATLGSIINAAIEAASPDIAAARHSLEVVVPEDPIWVSADRARLMQAVTNLLNNAAKYTPRGGRIRVEAASENGTAVVRVQDNGMGISPEALPTVFEMFRQVNRTDPSKGGLGIGLALVRQLVAMHQGTIEAHSAGVGQGAEFVVRLPMSDLASPPEPVKVTNDQPTGGRRLKVLVVDDNADLVDMLAMVVEGLGHDVRKALDGRTAISAAAAYRPDVVLLDLGLPVMNGIDVARQLRQHPETAHARLVALTGWGQSEDRTRTREAGFDHHLTKPTDARTLERLLFEVAKDASS